MSKIKFNKKGQLRVDGRIKGAKESNFIIAVGEVIFEHILKPLVNLCINLIFKFFKLIKKFFNK